MRILHVTVAPDMKVQCERITGKCWHYVYDLSSCSEQERKAAYQALGGLKRQVTERWLDGSRLHVVLSDHRQSSVEATHGEKVNLRVANRVIKKEITEQREALARSEAAGRRAAMVAPFIPHPRKPRLSPQGTSA